MAEFDHPNVLSLIGVCLDGGPAPFIVMPFMHNRSLIYHLKRERETLVLPSQEQPDSATVRMFQYSTQAQESQPRTIYGHL